MKYEACKFFNKTLTQSWNISKTLQKDNFLKLLRYLYTLASSKLKNLKVRSRFAEDHKIKGRQ